MGFTQTDAQELKPLADAARMRAQALVDAMAQAAAGQPVSQFQIAMLAAAAAQAALEVALKTEYAAGT